MSLPKEPRQKMINIMYLVLTALLALNVSSEILNAFKTIEQSLNSASNIIERKNLDIYKSLKSKLNDPKSAEKAAIWAPKAEQAHAYADAMYAYVESLKQELKVESGLQIKDGKEVYKEDDLDATTRLFLNKKSGESKGKDLYNKLLKFKQDLYWELEVIINESCKIGSHENSRVNKEIKKEFEALKLNLESRGWQLVDQYNFGEPFIIDSFGTFAFDVRIKVDYNNLNEWILENYPEILK